MSIQDAEVLAAFVEESREHLEASEADLLALEQNTDDQELINRIFRAVHSTKGGAGFFGLQKITKLSHTMENLMSKIRDGEEHATKDIIDMLLKGVDKLNAMVDDVENSESFDIEENLQALTAVLEKTGGGAEQLTVQLPSEKTNGDDELASQFKVDEYIIRDAIKHGSFLYAVKVFTHKDIKEKGKNPLNYIETLESFGTFIESRIDISSVTDLGDCLNEDIPFLFLFTTVLQPDLVSMGLEISEEQITNIPLDEYKEKYKVEETTEAEPKAEKSAPQAEEKAETPTETPEAKAETKLTESQKPKAPSSSEEKKAKKADRAVQQRHKTDETIRVPVSLLDDLMNLAGEMVLGRNQLLRMAETVSRQVNGLPSVLQNINLVTSELQEKVMQTRMQPIGGIFTKFSRIIRDMASKLNKEMKLETRGEDVELDKSIIELLSDPLTHIIRNSADHGIEMPDDRAAKGKPRCGTVRLSAFHEGGQVHIEIVDDGNGIDPEKVKAKAIEKAVISVEAAENLTEREALNLIFAPGFSTAEKVSDISGRGVGMDVVRTNIEHLSGNIDLESEIGKGSKITLRLPLTLAIIPSMIVGVGELRFAVPQVSLEELVKLNNDLKIEKVRDHDVMRLRGKLLPLIRLGELLRIRTEEEEEQQQKSRKAYVLVLKSDKNHFGLVIDKLLDSEEIVVKPLSNFLKKCKCYSGSTIMGDGKLAMILDVAGCCQFAGLEFTEIDKVNQANEQLQNKENDTETQSLLLFRSGQKEVFAINLELVRRIEKIPSADIQRVGEKEFLNLRDQTLRLVRLHNHLPVTKNEEEPENLYVIVPKLVQHPMGIIAEKVEDVVQSSVALDRKNLCCPGILGTAVIKDNLTIFVDIYGLFEMADPVNYKKAETNIDHLNGKKVLLAEDTEFFRIVETQYLTRFGCDVDVVPDGNKAWEKIQTNKYDIIVTDLEMPVMNGFELLRRIKAQDEHKHLPVVALTSLTSERFINKGLSEGFNAYETKLNQEHLKETLLKLL